MIQACLRLLPSNPSQGRSQEVMWVIFCCSAVTQNSLLAAAGVPGIIIFTLLTTQPQGVWQFLFHFQKDISHSPPTLFTRPCSVQLFLFPRLHFLMKGHNFDDTMKEIQYDLLEVINALRLSGMYGIVEECCNH